VVPPLVFGGLQYLLSYSHLLLSWLVYLLLCQLLELCDSIGRIVVVIIRQYISIVLFTKVKFGNVAIIWIYHYCKSVALMKGIIDKSMNRSVPIFELTNQDPAVCKDTYRFVVHNDKWPKEFLLAPVLVQWQFQPPLICAQTPTLPCSLDEFALVGSQCYKLILQFWKTLSDRWSIFLENDCSWQAPVKQNALWTTSRACLQAFERRSASRPPTTNVRTREF